MAVRITSENFATLQGETFRVEIHDSGVFSVANTVDVGQDGFTLDYSGETDKVVPGIIGSNAAVSIVVNPGNIDDLTDFLTDLIGSVETRFNIVIWRVVSAVDFLYWCGYVLKDLSGFEDIGSAYFLTVKATDGIGRLKGQEYKDTGSTPNIPWGNLQTSAHLTKCLLYVGTEGFWGGSDEWLRTVVSARDDNMPSPLTTDTDPLQFSRFPGEVFATRARSSDGNDYDWKSAYYVVEQICLHWGARLLLSDGAWRFEQVRERHESTFTERWYDNVGGFLGGTAGGGYDRAIPQNDVRSRLSGGEFSYLPALRRVEIIYDHKTQKNHLENLFGKWYKDSGANTPFVKTNISYDDNTYFKCSGVLNVDVEVVTYTKPWRYIFGIILKTTPGNYRIDSETTPVVAGGIGIPTLNREAPTWVVSSVYYEVSTPWIFSDRYVGQVPFGFYTPIVTSGETGFSVDFNSGIGGEDYAENSVAVTVNDWKWSDLVLALVGNNQASNLEIARKYKAENSTGNSDLLTLQNVFGHAVFGWTPCKIQTTDDDTFTIWTDTTATWTREGEADSFEFGDLLCNELARLQEIPAKTYSGAVIGDIIKAHSRLVFVDNSAWLMSRGTFTAKLGQWSGEWIGAGVSTGAGITSTDPVPIPGPEGFPPGTHEIIIASPDGLGSTTAVAGPSGNTALAFMTVNTTSTLTASGAVTTIDLEEPIKGNTFYDGNIVYLYNPQTGQSYGFEVDGDQAEGSTGINVVSVDHGINIPIGAQLLYSPYNIFTTSAGGPSTGLPIGSAEGQIMVWDDSAQEWVTLSGSTDGDVLTWDTTNGWQSEPAPSGGSGTGDINQSGNSFGAAITIGTNDDYALNLETNNVTRVSITSGASTGGAVTITDVTANTSTVEDIITLITNSTGSALAGLGPGILFKAEDSTTDSVSQGKLFYSWLSATHASSNSKFGIQVVVSAALTEIASFDGTNTTGRLLIGTSSPAVYARDGITTATGYTIGQSSSSLTLGNSTGVVVMSSSSTATTGAITITSTNNNGTGQGIRIGKAFLTSTSLTKAALFFDDDYTAASGTGILTAIRIITSYNVSGTATGVQKGIHINPTLTAIVGGYRAIDIEANNAAAIGIYQSGASTTNNLVGATAFGTTSAPAASAILDIVSTAKGLGLPAMTTAQVNAISSPRDGLAVYDTDTDTVKIRANGAWVSLGTGSGTVTGSGSAGQVAYWSGASAVAGENALFYDATNDRLGIGTVTPYQALDIRAGKIKLERAASFGGIIFADGDTADVNTRIDVDASGNIIFRTYGSTVGFQTYDTNATAAVFNWGNNGLALAPSAGGFFIVDGNTGINASQASGNLTINSYGGKFHFRKTNGGTNQALLDGGLLRIGDAATPTARLDIAGQGTTSSTYGVKVFDAAGTPVLLFAVQDNGVVSGNAFQTNSAAPTASYGTGAGTGPTTDLLAGGQNGFNFFFTTGTGPAASATVVTINLPKSFANGCAASWVAANAATQAIIGNFWLSGTGNNSITIAYAGTLAASTAYALSVTLIGY